MGDTRKDWWNEIEEGCVYGGDLKEKLNQEN